MISVIGVSAVAEAQTETDPSTEITETEEDGTDEATDNEGETIDGSTILEQSINTGCLDFQVIGVCIWFTYYYYGYEIDYSVKVRHYIPDAVVTAYPNTGESPWTDVQDYVEPQSTDFDSVEQDGGTQKEITSTERDQVLLFKNADVIGSPGVAWIDALSSTGYLCDPITTPYFPYFLSEYDPEWRDPLIESLLLFLPPTNWFRHVSTSLPGLSTWGPVYPRHGFIIQGHDYKAGSVIVQRAGDITTRNWQPHLYIPMREDDPPHGQWPPEEIIEGDELTHRWQQLIPASEADDCRVFADKSDQSSGTNDPFEERLSQKTGYAFNLWRPYECCKEEGAVLIADIDFAK